MAQLVSQQNTLPEMYVEYDELAPISAASKTLRFADLSNGTQLLIPVGGIKKITTTKRDGTTKVSFLLTDRDGKVYQISDRHARILSEYLAHLAEKNLAGMRFVVRRSEKNRIIV